MLLPTETLEPGVLEIGEHSLRLLQLHGHTGADLVVLDENSGVLFAGDILFHQRALTTPNSPGLDIWLADLDSLQATPWKLLVPGHGPLSRNRAPFEQMRDYLGWLDGLLRDAAASGADMNEVIQSISARCLPFSGKHLFYCISVSSRSSGMRPVRTNIAEGTGSTGVPLFPGAAAREGRATLKST